MDINLAVAMHRAGRLDRREFLQQISSIKVQLRAWDSSNTLQWLAWLCLRQ